ncbi:MAG: TIGR03986 family CRISPR-associated RAMP protein [Actinomycetaceae bacterium]|nr:TIGR03986 family CRISPR-associated RAMP protein [Actinomycetaceae bacterium]
MTRFVNPYTFVPSSKIVHRDKPQGHASMGDDRLSGYFTWRLDFKTPLVLPQDGVPRTSDGRLLYPGSALRGVLRNLYETLTNSCYRILDYDALPVHREPMVAGTKRYTLAVVSKVDPAGKVDEYGNFSDSGETRDDLRYAVTELRLCDDDDLVWVSQDVLKGGLSRPFRRGIPSAPARLRSGAKLSVNNALTDYVEYSDRNETVDSAAISRGKDWVMHLSDAGSRFAKQNLFVPTGRLTDEYVSITPQVWLDYRRTCVGSKDLIGKPAKENTWENRPEKPEFTSVVWDKQVDNDNTTRILIGDRRKADGWLYEGDTVWVEWDENGEVCRLKLATIWRDLGKGTVSERMSKDLLPCRNPNKLCPACQVFGSVDPYGAESLVPEDLGVHKEPVIDQSGYASHVKVGWATSANSVKVDKAELPPMRNPKISSGGFYLEPPSDGSLLTASKAEDHIPRAHWGSELDLEKLRSIRGRKYYWHGDDAKRRERSQQHKKLDERHRKNRQPEKVDPSRKIVKNVVLESRVSFNNLTERQLALLLMAAQPQVMEDPKDKDELAIHIGGGKPVGYGSAVASVDDLWIQNATQRYHSGLEHDKRDLNDFCEEFKQSGRGVPGFEDIEKAAEYLKKVLSWKPVLIPDGRRQKNIAYPPGTGDKFNRDHQRFYESFRWFGQHSGAREGDLITLPVLQAKDQTLPIRTVVDGIEINPQRSRRNRGGRR